MKDKNEKANKHRSHRKDKTANSVTNGWKGKEAMRKGSNEGVQEETGSKAHEKKEME